jgi:hypothetical protein
VSVEDNPLPYIGEDRRVSSKDRRDCPYAEQNARMFREGTERMNRIEAALGENTAATKEMLEILQMGKGFFKTTKMLGDVLKWAIGIAIAVVTAWHAWKDQ